MAYSKELKHSLLGIPLSMLSSTVTKDVAMAMANNILHITNSDYGIGNIFYKSGDMRTGS